jgi:DNA polymerase (family 10)
VKIVNRKRIVDILEEIALLLQLKGENIFKTRAYSDGARIIENLDDDIDNLVKEDRLKDIKGIGIALNSKIKELVEKGELEYYENLKKEIPEGLIEMLKIQGLGAKKIKLLYDKLNIISINELEKAALNNKLIELPGFGLKTQKKIIENIKLLNSTKGLMLYSDAEFYANEILKSLEKSDNVIRAEICGSLRRKKEIVKDIDILVSTKDVEVRRIFLEHELTEKIISKGNTKCSIMLKNGINADLRIVKDEEFPFALHHFTGSKEHNVKMRHNAKEKGITMNEYGIFKGDKLIRCEDEKEIFKTFDMDYIEPELRENLGEIEFSKNKKLPELIKLKDIKGIIHVHSNYSDGENKIEDLAKYCIKKGFSYLVLSDHSKTAFYANGLSEEDIIKQHKEIDFINNKYKNFKIFKSIELDILKDGTFDYDDKILRSFDLRIASIHSSFSMDEETVTKRVIKAMESGFVNILGHPTGRLLLKREPLKINMGKLVNSAIQNNVVLEINANPKRLDLDWRYIKSAKDKGCLFVISPDAHSFEGIEFIKYGINIAKKGWLESKNVVNAFNLNDFEQILCKVNN